jgi:putative NIF3 family GTP cyclohydrolase 1 type 2
VTNDALPALADVVTVLEQMYDPDWARDWDAVGLVCGDPSAQVRRVLLAVDPAPLVIEEAIAWRADLVLTHHPLLFHPVHSVAATTAKGRAIHQLVRAGCGLYTAHTNADVAAPGVSDALARVLGLTDLTPLSADPADTPTRSSPRAGGQADKVVDAGSCRCRGDRSTGGARGWHRPGTVPGEHSAPVIGSPVAEVVTERRVEMVLPRQGGGPR